MSHKRAKDVLPDELIAIIQRYVDGEYVYIPRKRGSERSWGEQSGARRTLDERNKEIRERFKSGWRKEQLADAYHLSVKSIERIVYKRE
jgi:DNA-binding NarL/FixJ family response regulator